MKRFLMVLTFLTIASPTFGAVLYNQPRIFPGGNIAVSESSTEFGGIVQICFDNFSLANASSIDEVTWAGAYFTTPTQAIQSFTITFYANNSGRVGSALLSQTIAGNANETAAGTDNSGRSTFTYDAVLTTPFAASAGTTYWMSIVANLTNTQPFWSWGYATGGEQLFYVNQPASSNFFARISGDLAFSLIENPISTAVPEPSTITLAATSVLGLIALRRRKAQSI